MKQTKEIVINLVIGVCVSLVLGLAFGSLFYLAVCLLGGF